MCSFEPCLFAYGPLLNLMSAYFGSCRLRGFALFLAMIQRSGETVRGIVMIIRILWAEPPFVTVYIYWLHCSLIQPVSGCYAPLHFVMLDAGYCITFIFVE